jgi:hypothetical protein
MHASRLAVASFLALVPLAPACSKSDATSTGPAASAVAVPTEAPTISITGTPTAPAPAASASAVSSASASAPASAPASASAKPAASARSVTATTAAVAASAPTPTPAPVALKPAASHLSGKNFVLDAASPGCRVDTPCTMTLRLAAAGEYHVNKEYPYKFIAAAAPGVQFLGSADANTFSRAAGDFREDGEKTATLTVRFKPTAAGEARVSGTYKMSVCSAENCQIETPTITLAVPVM